jgi:adenylylsulfate kinase
LTFYNKRRIRLLLECLWSVIGDNSYKKGIEMMKSKNVTWVEGVVRREDRECRHRHKGAILWLTGLSASGKTTIAIELEKYLFENNKECYRLDGDNIRHGLNNDLGFSPEDRDENIRRIGEVAKLFADAGFIVITSFISPYKKDRDRVRKSTANPEDFIEIYLDCSVEECEKRDPKGLYAKARAGLIPEFTGISAPYEIPANPEITLYTAKETIHESIEKLINFLIENNYLHVNIYDEVLTAGEAI